MSRSLLIGALGLAGCMTAPGAPGTMIVQSIDRDSRLFAGTDRVFWNVFAVGVYSQHELYCSRLADPPLVEHRIAFDDGNVVVAGDQALISSSGMISLIDCDGTVHPVVQAPHSAAALGWQATSGDVAWAGDAVQGPASVSWLHASEIETVALVDPRSIASIAIAPDAIYASVAVADDAELWRIDRSSLAATRVASASALASEFTLVTPNDKPTYGPRSVTIDGTDVLWTINRELLQDAYDYAIVMAFPLDGGAPTRIVDGMWGTTDYLLHDGWLYWTEQRSTRDHIPEAPAPAIWRASRAGAGAVSYVRPASAPTDIQLAAFAGSSVLGLYPDEEYADLRSVPASELVPVTF